MVYISLGERQKVTHGITADKGFYWGDYKFTTAAAIGPFDVSFRGGLTKYNTKSASGTVDNLITLELVDDAAYVTDNSCRMPTKEDIEELITNTTSTWETLNGVNGTRFTSKINGNSIFVPAAGYCSERSVNSVGSGGCLWGSSLDESSPNSGWGLGFGSSYVGVYDNIRKFGNSVRAVKD